MGEGCLLGEEKERWIESWREQARPECDAHEPEPSGIIGPLRK